MRRGERSEPDHVACGWQAEMPAGDVLIPQTEPVACCSNYLHFKGRKNIFPENPFSHGRREEKALEHFCIA
jgi:hypothetical protein